MQVHPDCPLPPEGQLRAWCRSNFCGGAWLIVNHTGKIITQYGEPWSAARHVNGA